jgi:hypothetical protein
MSFLREIYFDVVTLLNNNHLQLYYGSQYNNSCSYFDVLEIPVWYEFRLVLGLL